MRSKKGLGSGRNISGMFVFLLIGMYALFSLLLVLIGAGVYQRITDAADLNAQMRTSLTYVAGKVRAGDEAGNVAVEQVDGAPVLVLAHRHEDEMLLTRIFFLPDGGGGGGALYELTAPADEEEPLELTMGERISEVAAFHARMVGGGLELSVTMPGGAEHSMYLHLRSQTAI